MTSKSIEELGAELARQDEEFKRAAAAFEEAGGASARFETPSAFFEELEELCNPRPSVPTHFVFALRV